MSKENRKKSSGPATKNVSGKEGNRFYSPLVRNIARAENITREELETIEGTGVNGRIRKDDVLKYLENRQNSGATAASDNAEDEIREMDQSRRVMADNMVQSKRISAHVTTMVEADVTNIVEWRNNMKDRFQQREGYKLSFLPVFIDATARALRDYPQVNASVEGNRIIMRKDVNIGITVALPNGDTSVPVIRQVDKRNLLGINHEMERLVKAARNNKLSPEDTAEGTFSITNYGSFRNVMGTPIIHQPQVAIMAMGTIEKKPAVLETPSGDVIAIRSKMFLSLSYDYRVVNDAVGGAFIRQVADYLETFDKNQKI